MNRFFILKKSRTSRKFHLKSFSYIYKASFIFLNLGSTLFFGKIINKVAEW